MKSVDYMRRTLWFLFFILLFTGCEEKMDDHYKEPDWFKGSAWDILEDKGNHSIFLKAVERAGFRSYLEGKGIVTLMAPEDNAFDSYLSSKGTSVEEMPIAELSKLVGFHLLYYSYSKNNLANFRPEGQIATDADGFSGPGMYYKFRTRSTNPPSVMLDADNKERTVYHLERFVPVFSQNFFRTKGIEDPDANYRYFYPDSEWTSDPDGFNVSDASVKEYALEASNGFVYIIDRVLEPLETIYTELDTNPEYSLFLNMYDQYGNLQYDADLSADFGAAIGVDSLWLFEHEYMPPIALEWPTSRLVNLDLLASVSYSVFAPSNTALTVFFDNYWKGKGYESYDDLDPLIRLYFLYEFVHGGSIVFPEEIVKGNVISTMGTPYNFNPYEAQFRKICVNGSLYGLDKIDASALLSSVIGPSFQNKNLLYFLYAVYESGTLFNYANHQFEYTSLIPNNQTFANSDIGLRNGSPLNSLVENPDSEEPVGVSSSQMLSIVDAHITNRKIEFKTTGTQVVEMSNTPYNYWYIKNGGITCNRFFNRMLNPGTHNPFIPFRKVNNGNWNNGNAYVYEGTEENGAQLFETDLSDINIESNLQYALAVNNDSNYPYYAFSQLLKKAGMFSGNTLRDIQGRYILFMPTNAAIEQALSEGRIPGMGTRLEDPATNQETLRTYLRNYFINAAGEGIVTYPYPGSEMESKQYSTFGTLLIDYTDNGVSLSVQSGNGNTIPVSGTYDYFPFAYNDGAFHFIDGVF